jgi:CubicO group peptidase (beta-lactamase class C family)
MWQSVLRRATIGLALLACSVRCYSADSFDPDEANPSRAGMDAALVARIPAKMKTYVESGRAAGFVTIVARHGHVASLEAVGYQDLEAKIPMRKDTIFRMASMTKSLTAAGIMILVDEGRLSLLDPVESFLPEFKGIQVNLCAGLSANDGCAAVKPVHPITVLELLTHTSGLPGQGADQSSPFKSLAERVSVGAHISLIAQPGTKWIYSQIGYAALGRIIEVCSGKSYEQFLDERLFQPLGMKDTYFFLPAAKRGRLAVLYTLDDTGKLARAAHDPVETAVIPSPEGGALSTAADMARFYQMLLNKGNLNGRRVLSGAAVEAMTTNHTGEMKNVEASPGLGMGLSFGVIKDSVGTYRYQSLGTFCKGGAFRTYGWGDPAKDLLGVILFQRTNGGGDTAPEINEFSILANAAIAE